MAESKANMSTADQGTRELRDVVDAVRALGDRARYLAVNLAVAAAKLKQLHMGGHQLNSDMLDLVSRITRVSQDVADAVTAMERGSTLTKPTSPTIWNRWRDVGVPDESTLERLTASLNDTMEMARHIFRWVREHATPDDVRPQAADHPDHFWTGEGGEPHQS
ncbi:MAG: hypothetical protein AB1792_03380 [Candidatus Zixiibacteriota bacterium]